MQVLVVVYHDDHHYICGWWKEANCSLHTSMSPTNLALSQGVLYTWPSRQVVLLSCMVLSWITHTTLFDSFVSSIFSTSLGISRVSYDRCWEPAYFQSFCDSTTVTKIQWQTTLLPMTPWVFVCILARKTWKDSQETVSFFSLIINKGIGKWQVSE